MTGAASSELPAAIADTLKGLAKRWPRIADLTRELATFVAASDGLDGRRLRKAVVGAAAMSIDTARDPGLTTSQQVLASIKAAGRSAKEAGREAA